MSGNLLDLLAFKGVLHEKTFSRDDVEDLVEISIDDFRRDMLVKRESMVHWDGVIGDWLSIVLAESLNEISELVDTDLIRGVAVITFKQDDEELIALREFDVLALEFRLVLPYRSTAIDFEDLNRTFQRTGDEILAVIRDVERPHSGLRLVRANTLEGVVAPDIHTSLGSTGEE